MMFIRFAFIIFLLSFSFSFPQNNKVPIIAFHGVPSGKFSTEEQFINMKSAGIDICYTVFNSKEEVIKALNASQTAGTKLIINIKALQIDIKNAVNLFKNYPALYGYALADEPSPIQFDDLRKDILQISSLDKKHIIYINLYPNYVPKQLINDLSYENYVKKFVEQVPVKFISFDHYPIIKNEVRENWYENLETIRNISAQNNLPFWAFACSTIHYSYFQPTLQGVRLQQFSNLLYGAQALQYFTYWTLSYEDNWKKEKYGYSIVDDQGNPTPTYNIVKKVNLQIQRLAWVFFGANSDKVYHTGTEIPEGTSKLISVPKGFKYFSTNGKNALVSLMSNGKNRFVIIQNKSLNNNITLDYQLGEPMKIVDNFSGKTKNISSTKKLKASILPGDVLIFNSNNN